MERIREKRRRRGKKRPGEKIQDWSREKQRREQEGKYKFIECKKVEANKSVSCTSNILMQCIRLRPKFYISSLANSNINKQKTVTFRTSNAFYFSHATFSHISYGYTSVVFCHNIL